MLRKQQNIIHTGISVVPTGHRDAQSPYQTRLTWIENQISFIHKRTNALNAEEQVT